MLGLAIMLGGCFHEPAGQADHPPSDQHLPSDPGPPGDPTSVPAVPPILMARATAVVKVRVTGTTEVDARPADGPLERRYDLEVLASSGDPITSVSMMLTGGGHTPNGAPPDTSAQRRNELDANFLQVGQTYWLLAGRLAPEEMLTAYNGAQPPMMLAYPLLGWWAETDAPDPVKDALKQDRYGWRPSYHPASGLTFGHLTVNDQAWKIMAKAGNTDKWEAIIEGKPDTADGSIRHVLFFADRRYGLQPIEPALQDEPEELIYAHSRIALGIDNRFGVEAGEYRVLQARLVDDGDLIAELAYTTKSGTFMALRQYRRGSGVLQFTVNIDYLSAVGLAVGNADDHWIRKTERFHDRDGALMETRVFKYQKTFDDRGYLVSHGYVPLDAD